MKYSKKFSLFFLLLLLIPFHLPADWPMFMGNHYLTGNNDEIVPEDNKLNWTFAAPSYLYYPVSHKGMVFVTCLDKYLYAVDEITGRMIWKCRLEKPALKSPVVWGNYVLVTASDYIYCIDIYTGRIYWSRKETDVSIQLSTPMIIDNIVYYASRKKYFARYARNGHILWENPKVKIYGGSSIYWNQRIYFLSKDYSRGLSQLYCLSATNGKLMWRQNLPSDPNIFTPVVYNRKVFVGSGSKLYSFDARTGEVLWIKQCKKERIASSTVFANNRFYMSLDDGRIYMLNPVNGNIIDSFENFNEKGTKFIIAGETVFIPNRKGALYSYQSFKKKLNWKFQTDFTDTGGTLSSANGRVYLASGNHLYSISTGILPPPPAYIASAPEKAGKKEPFEMKRPVLPGAVPEIKKPEPKRPEKKKIEKEKIEVTMKDRNNNPLSGEVLVNQNKKRYKYPVKNGKAVIEVEKDKEFSVTAKAKDHFPKTVHRKPKEKRKGIDITLDPLKKQAVYTYNDITFKYDSAELAESSFPTLKAIAELFKNNPNLKIEIAGHTDSRGSDDYNLKLSERRAGKVKEFLIKSGVTDIRIESKGFGESKPIAPNDTDEGMAKNRRVEFKIK